MAKMYIDETSEPAPKKQTSLAALMQHLQFEQLLSNLQMGEAVRFPINFSEQPEKWFRVSVQRIEKPEGAPTEAEWKEMGA